MLSRPQRGPTLERSTYTRQARPGPQGSLRPPHRVVRNSFNILLLPGDGIGPEVVEAARTVMDVAAEHFGVTLCYEERRVGGVAIREEGEPISDETLEKAKASDAILLGA